MSKAQLKKFGVELKPCPFCGYKYRGTSIVGPDESRFECPRCAAMGPFPTMLQDNQLAVIEAWNRRAEGNP